MRVISNSRKVRIADIKENLFVRKELNTQRAVDLADLIEAGVEMRDKIEVLEDLTIVDGRHRKAGFELALMEEISVRVLSFDDKSEMISYAYNANAGGSLPPTADDTEHTVMLLLEEGESKKRIAQLIKIPDSVVGIYIDKVKSKLLRSKLAGASRDVAENDMTVPKAAEKWGVEVVKLREMMSARRKKNKQGVGHIKSRITGLYRSVSQTNAAMLRNAIKEYGNGDMTEEQVKDIFSALKGVQKKSAHSVEDWFRRFEERCRIAGPSSVV